MTEPVRVKTVVLEYAPPERRRWVIARFLRSLIRPAIFLIVGVALGAWAGFLASPPVIYIAEGLLEVYAAIPTLSVSQEIAEAEAKEYARRRNLVLSILTETDLADVALNEETRKYFPITRTPNQLRKNLSIEDFPSTEFIRFRVEDSDFAQSELLCAAFGNAALKRLQDRHVRGFAFLVETERPIGPFRYRDQRRQYVIWGSVMGAVIILLILRPRRRCYR